MPLAVVVIATLLGLLSLSLVAFVLFLAFPLMAFVLFLAFPLMAFVLFLAFPLMALGPLFVRLHVHYLRHRTRSRPQMAPPSNPIN
jgi:hypothetical protein